MKARTMNDYVPLAPNIGRPRRHRDNIDDDAAAAAAAGMSYGRYKALHPYTKDERASQRQVTAAKQEKPIRKGYTPASYEKVCIVCGKKYIAHHASRKYCGSWCKEKHDRAVKKASRETAASQEGGA